MWARRPRSRWLDAHAWSLVIPALVGAWALAGPAAADPQPTRASPRRLTSPALRAVRAEVRPAFAALRRAAPGRRWIRDPGGDRVRVGRTYEERVWRASLAPTDDLPARLVAIMRAALRPDPDDEAFYASAGALGDAAPAAIVEAFRIEHALDRREQEGVAALARELARALARHPDLVLLAARCGWGDAVGSAVHGVMLVDRGAGEVLWLHVEDVWSEG